MADRTAAGAVGEPAVPATSSNTSRARRTRSSWGIRPSIPFIVMLVFLLVYNGLQEERFAIDTRRAAEPVRDLVDADNPPRWRRLLPIAVCLVGVLVAPEFLNGLWLAIVASGLALATAFLSYMVVTGERRDDLALPDHLRRHRRPRSLPNSRRTTTSPCCWRSCWRALVVVPIGMIAALPSLRLGTSISRSRRSPSLSSCRTRTSRRHGSTTSVRASPCRGRAVSAGDRAFYYLLVVLFVAVALLVRNSAGRLIHFQGGQSLYRGERRLPRRFDCAGRIGSSTPSFARSVSIRMSSRGRPENGSLRSCPTPSRTSRRRFWGVIQTLPHRGRHRSGLSDGCPPRADRGDDPSVRGADWNPRSTYRFTTSRS